jgi:trk system potassium uptake protein TrkA
MRHNKFAVIGVGRYGINIAKRLAEKGAQVFAFDPDEEKIESIKDEVAFAVTLDATDKKALQSQKLNDMDAVVVAIGENFEATILTCVHLLDLGVSRIIARASGVHQKLILEKIGIKEILTPEDEVAFVVREKLINPSILSFLQLPDDYEIAEILAPKGVLGRSIDNIEFRNQYELTLVTIKRCTLCVNKNGDETKEQHVLGVPSSDTQIKEDDTLVVFGTSKNVQRFMDINEL